MSPPATRRFWALGTGYNSGAVIQKFPDGSPPHYAFFEATPLASTFPNPAVMRFSDGFRKQTEVLDSVACDLSVPIVSEKVRGILDRVAPGSCEFLPVVLLNHRGRIASKGHAILNPLHTADLIDMKRSKYRPNSFDSTEIASLTELHVLPGRVDPAVHIFRAETMPDQIFIDETVHDAFTQAHLTGLRLFPAEGWNGDTM